MTITTIGVMAAIGTLVAWIAWGLAGKIARQRAVKQTADEISKIWVEAEKKKAALPDPDAPMTREDVQNELRDIAKRGRDPE